MTGCTHCRDNRQLDALDVSGNVVEAKGGCYVFSGSLLMLSTDDMLQDKIPINFCPMCGKYLQELRLSQ